MIEVGKKYQVSNRKMGTFVMIVTAIRGLNGEWIDGVRVEADGTVADVGAVDPKRQAANAVTVREPLSSFKEV